MRKYVFSLVVLVSVLLLVVSCSYEEDPVEEKPITAMEFVASMKIGWNLGNTMEGHDNLTPGEAAWQSNKNLRTSQTLMDGVAALGFGAVRIPVTWGTKIGAAPDYTIDSVWIDRVAEIVGYVHNAGMKAIINIHHDGADSSYWLSVKDADLTGANKDAIDAKFKGVWTNIAEYFKDVGEDLIFEAFNELHDGTWGDGNAAQHKRINELNQIFVDAVRAVGGENENRYLIIPGWVTRPSVTVRALELPTDTTEDKLIVTVHFYDPYNFTDVDGQDVWGTKSGAPAWGNENNVKNTFNSVKNKFVNNGIPVIIGEYGAANRPNTGSTPTQFDYQKYYMEYVTKYAHDCGFIPFFWDNNGDGTGNRKFKLIGRSGNTNGKPANNNAKIILDLMMKAVNENYSLEDIVAP